MVDPCGEPGFAAETLGELAGQSRGGDDIGPAELEGDLAVEDRVVPTPDLPHAAGVDRLDQLIPASYPFRPHYLPWLPALGSLSIRPYLHLRFPSVKCATGSGGGRPRTWTAVRQSGLTNWDTGALLDRALLPRPSSHPASGTTVTSNPLASTAYKVAR